MGWNVWCVVGAVGLLPSALPVEYRQLHAPSANNLLVEFKRLHSLVAICPRSIVKIGIL